MTQLLSGKSALVTGGTMGIGKAIAASLLQAGATTAICSRKQEHVDKAVEELSSLGDIRGIAADVSKWDDVQNLFQFVDSELHGLDILVNNAGAGIFASVAELTPEDWRQVIDLNLSGVFYCSHSAIPVFQKRGGGYIINISSLAGKNAFAGGAAYNASKFGLNGFSEAMMLDHRQENIRVSTIMPGSVDTRFNPQGEPADWKIAPEDIAEIVMTLLRLPERTLVSRVEVRPSKPPKKQ